MEIVWKTEGSPLPLPSLHLLVPPIRLMSAFMWQVAQQRNVMQYDKLVEFITLVTEIVPELLSSSQRDQLILGLRARLVLELCRTDGLANLQTIQSHLDKIHSCTAELSSTPQKTGTDVLKTSYTNFANLVQKMLIVPFEKEYFFQEVFPTHYGSVYDQNLQQLVSEFLSRLEQLLPTPDYTQTAAWFAEATSVAEELGQHLSEPSALKILLLHHRQRGTLSAVGQTSKFTCPQCSFAHRIKKKLQEHIQRAHQRRAPPERKEMVRKSRGSTKKYSIVENKNGHTPKSVSEKNRERKPKDAPKKKRECKQKDASDKRERKRNKDNLENKKEQRKRKEPEAEDRRFLSMRPANKNFTEEETKCSKCQKVFELPNQLKTHLKLHTLPFHCSQCEKGFVSKSGYYQHQRLHKKGRIFACTHCNRGFLCAYSLKQHERMHTEGPSHLCVVCGKRFSKAGIVRHMLMHKGERNYLCTTCGKSFLSSGELLLHIRSHTGETPYTCTHCGKGFSTKSHLMVHIRSHTGERPYPCSQCPKRFLTLNCLKRHMLCHDGVKPFKCPNCGKEFSQQGNLKRHLTTHQPDT
ncbi:uncharacterized protein ACN63O_017080 [Diretmus argenteus]